MSTVDAALAGAAADLATAGIERPRFEARLLLEAASGRSRAEILVNGSASLPEPEADRFSLLVARRRQREPMAYILGRVEFWSLDFAVQPGVLVPRADSETLIEAAISAVPDTERRLRILEMGVGSGCLIVTLLHVFPRAEGIGTDLDETALACTRLNAERLGVVARLGLERTSWAAGVDGPFDLVVSNPPYIRSAEIAALQPEVARFEPRTALDGGPDGLVAYRAILADLPRLLASDGRAFLEIGHDQHHPLAALAVAAGFAVTAHHDLAGVARCLELGGTGLDPT
ncbi:MAG: peptide chain release factor N(5)-glutamine methyltransferase [Geminicoccaceae bacterium]